jgi:equilibrative nucleoside transporter 1/2/3
MAAALARFLLIPAFYFTAKYGAQGYMIFLTSFLGLSNGYLTVCVLTEAPKGYNVSFPLLYISCYQLQDRQIDFSLQSFVQGPEQNALGNVLVVFLMIGLFSGVVLDWLWLIGKGW